MSNFNFQTTVEIQNQIPRKYLQEYLQEYLQVSVNHQLRANRSALVKMHPAASELASSQCGSMPTLGSIRLD